MPAENRGFLKKRKNKTNCLATNSCNKNPQKNTEQKKKFKPKSHIFSHLDMATGLNSCLRLSGSFCLPPYPFPAGFMVTKMPESGSRSTRLSRRVTERSPSRRAVWMGWIWGGQEGDYVSNYHFLKNETSGILSGSKLIFHLPCTHEDVRKLRKRSQINLSLTTQKSFILFKGNCFVNPMRLK